MCVLLNRTRWIGSLKLIYLYIIFFCSWSLNVLIFFFFWIIITFSMVTNNKLRFYYYLAGVLFANLNLFMITKNHILFIKIRKIWPNFGNKMIRYIALHYNDSIFFKLNSPTKLLPKKQKQQIIEEKKVFCKPYKPTYEYADELKSAILYAFFIYCLN